MIIHEVQFVEIDVYTVQLYTTVSVAMIKLEPCEPERRQTLSVDVPRKSRFLEKVIVG